MEKKKINFSDIKGMLSKDQMKSIKGGSIGDPSCGGDTLCTYFANGVAKTGECGSYGTPTNFVCVCYSPTPGYMNFDSSCTRN